MWIRFLPYIAAASIAIGGAYLIYNAGYESGENAAKLECDARIELIEESMKAALNAANEKYDKRVIDAENRAREYWKSRQKIEIVTQEIEKEVIKYVKSETANDNYCDLDANFLRIWNSANSNDSRIEADKSGIGVVNLLPKTTTY